MVKLHARENSALNHKLFKKIFPEEEHAPPALAPEKRYKKATKIQYELLNSEGIDSARKLTAIHLWRMFGEHLRYITKDEFNQALDNITHHLDYDEEPGKVSEKTLSEESIANIAIFENFINDRSKAQQYALELEFAKHKKLLKQAEKHGLKFEDYTAGLWEQMIESSKNTEDALNEIFALNQAMSDKLNED